MSILSTLCIVGKLDCAYLKFMKQVLKTSIFPLQAVLHVRTCIISQTKSRVSSYANNLPGPLDREVVETINCCETF